MPAVTATAPVAVAPIFEESSDDDLSAAAAITSAAKCVIVGDLEVATTHTLTTFVIETYTRDGEKQTAGGDRFLVTIRGRGEKVRPTVADHGTGRYTVGFKPHTSGKLLISITLGGEAVAASPYTCRVCNLVASAPCCVVRGAALTAAIARQEHSFEVMFKNALGQVAHAEDLDVYIEEEEEEDDEEDEDEKEQSTRAWAAHGHPARASRADSHADPSMLSAVMSADVAFESDVKRRDEHVDSPEGGGNKDGAHDGASGAPSTASQRRQGAERLRVELLRTAECTVTSRKPLVLRQDVDLASERIGQVQPGVRLLLLQVVMALENGEQCVRASVAYAPDETGSAYTPLSSRRAMEEDWRSTYAAKPEWLTLGDLPPSPMASPSSISPGRLKLRQTAKTPVVPSSLTPAPPAMPTPPAMPASPAMPTPPATPASTVRGSGPPQTGPSQTLAPPATLIATTITSPMSAPMSAPSGARGAAGQGAQQGAPWSCAPRTWTIGVQVRPPSPSRALGTAPSSFKGALGTAPSSFKGALGTAPTSLKGASPTLTLKDGAKEGAISLTLKDGAKEGAPAATREQTAAACPVVLPLVPSLKLKPLGSCTLVSPAARRLERFKERLPPPPPTPLPPPLPPPPPAPLPSELVSIGWVTVYKSGRELVTARRIHSAAERQQHIRQWARRVAVDRKLSGGSTSLSLDDKKGRKKQESPPLALERLGTAPFLLLDCL